MTASGLLKDTVVLISGGTQGLGAGIARQAAAEGAAGIAVSGRSAAAGGKIAEHLTGLGVPAVFLQADLGDTQQASSTVIRTVEHFGRLDAVVNAAGLTTRGSMTDTTPELFDERIAVNLKAPFFIMSEAIKLYDPADIQRRHLLDAQMRANGINPGAQQPTASSILFQMSMSLSRLARVLPAASRGDFTPWNTPTNEIEKMQLAGEAALQVMLQFPMTKEVLVAVEPLMREAAQLDHHIVLQASRHLAKIQ